MVSIEKEFEQSKIIAVLRNISPDRIGETVEALYRGGIRFVEVPFDQKDIASNTVIAREINELVSRFRGKVHIGAGTVCTDKQLSMAYEAGAELIVAPNTDEEIIRRTVKLGLISMPGACTPSEMQTAHKCGAHFIKLFPGSAMSLHVVKDLLVPLNHLKCVYFGGVTPQNLREIFSTGIIGVGVAGGVLDRSAIESGNFNRITQLAVSYTEQMGENDGR